MFIQIRGTFGSGKTTVVKGLMKRMRKLGAEEAMIVHAGVEFAHRFTKVKGLVGRVYVIGRYTDQACSGADSLSWKGVQEVIRTFVEKKLRKGHHVILEGVMSHSGKYIELGKSLEKSLVRVRFFDMATPLDECRARVMSRRKKKWIANGKKGVLKDLNPTSQTGHFNAVKSLHEKTLAAKLPCEFLHSTKTDIDRLMKRILE